MCSMELCVQSCKNDLDEMKTEECNLDLCLSEVVRNMFFHWHSEIVDLK
jgi:hypothetical protein